MKPLHTVVLATAATLVMTASAVAADYSVSPIPVSVSSGTKTASITIRNKGKSAVHFAVQGFRWTQSPQSSMILTADSSLVLYPRSFTVAAGETRSVRIGFPPQSSTSKETAFRVLVEELPEPNAVTGKGAGVVVRTNVGIPVFVEPAKTTSAQQLRAASFKGTNLDVMLENDGNVHIEPSTVTAVGTDALGKQTFSVTKAGWYVLAGSVAPFAFTVPAGACEKTTSIAVTAGSGKNVFKGSTANIARSCK